MMMAISSVQFFDRMMNGVETPKRGHAVLQPMEPIVAAIEI
jgi:hypothetical protein